MMPGPVARVAMPLKVAGFRQLRSSAEGRMVYMDEELAN
jgi:hypothetical protein